jgi:hypothetical protein
MSLFTDQKYVGLLSPRLDLLKQVRPNLWNSRCPICGDSSKNRSKKRLYIYLKKQELIVKCHNCGYGASLGNFIKHLDPHLYGQYVLDRYGEGVSTHRGVKKPEFKFKTPKFKPRPTTIDLPSIGSLTNTHHARLFYEGRKIPNTFLEKVFYAEDFRKWAMSVSKIDYSNLGRGEPRMVIPFYDTEGKLIAAQGRALGSHELRYITIKVTEESTKVYGLERWNSEETTYIVEGPIDSMFLPNCLAVAGGDLQSIKLDKKQCVLIFDNEPRNEHTVKKLMRAINDGWNVVVWPKIKIFKDINDLIIDTMTTDEILEMINKNTMNGLEADWAARGWRNVQ